MLFRSGISNFPNTGYAPGLDISSLLLNALVTPGSLHENYTGVTIVSSAGNSGHGYGTIGAPGISSFGLSVGAVTNNDFVGYGSFKDQPRFGNTTDHSDHIVDFSSRGPGIIGDPKPDLVSIGAYGFVPTLVTKYSADSENEPFILALGLAYVWRKGDLEWVKFSVPYGRGRYRKLTIIEETPVSPAPAPQETAA